MMALYQSRYMPTVQESLTVYLAPEVKEELAKWAQEEQRSMSFLAAQLITAAIKTRQNPPQDSQLIEDDLTVNKRKKKGPVTK